MKDDGDILRVFRQLGVHEREVLCHLADRLLMGQRTYGELKSEDTRDWAKEASEEALDGCIYLALQTMSLRDD